MKIKTTTTIAHIVMALTLWAWVPILFIGQISLSLTLLMLSVVLLSPLNQPNDTHFYLTKYCSRTVFHKTIMWLVYTLKMYKSRKVVFLEYKINQKNCIRLYDSQYLKSIGIIDWFPLDIQNKDIVVVFQSKGHLIKFLLR